MDFIFFGNKGITKKCVECGEKYHGPVGSKYCTTCGIDRVHCGFCLSSVAGLRWRINLRLKQSKSGLLFCNNHCAAKWRENEKKSKQGLRTKEAVGVGSERILSEAV